MSTVLTICADCERQALRFPKHGRAMTETLAALAELLVRGKHLQDLRVVREECLQNCPLGKICVALRCGHREVRHHLSPDDDLRAVAAKLTGTARPKPS